MLFWHLLLAHFIADYPLQNRWMVINKQRLPILLLHVGIHLMVMLILFEMKLWPYVLALAGIHFVIDYIKNMVNARWPEWILVPYIVDQCIHYVTIWALALWITRTAGDVTLPFSTEVAVYATGYLVATHVWFISERILAHTQPQYQEEVIAQAWPRMAIRATLLSLVLWLARGEAPEAAMLMTVSLIPYIRSANAWRALLTDLLVVLFSGILVLWGMP